MIRHSISLLATALLLGGCLNAGQPAARPSEPETLKITSWNLEHLAERDGLGCRPRTAADYAELKRHVEALDADVIAFQEVETAQAARRVFDPQHYEVVMSTRPASGRGGACYGATGQSIRQQAVGFAIRKGVPWSRNPDLADLRSAIPICAGESISRSGAVHRFVCLPFISSPGATPDEAPPIATARCCSTSCRCSKPGSMRAPPQARPSPFSATGTDDWRHAATHFMQRSTMAILRAQT